MESKKFRFDTLQVHAGQNLIPLLDQGQCPSIKQHPMYLMM